MESTSSKDPLLKIPTNESPTPQTIPNKQFKDAATAIFKEKQSEAKLFDVIQQLNKSPGSDGQLAVDAKCPPENPEHNGRASNYRERFAVATEAIIAAQQIYEAANRKLTASPAAKAFSKLTGTTHNNVDFLPIFFQTFLASLTAFQDAAFEQLGAVKKIIEPIIYWETILSTVYITSGIFWAWLIGYLNFSLGWAVIIMMCTHSAYRRTMQRIKVKIKTDAERSAGLKTLEMESETVEWLNNFLHHFWVQYEPSLSESLKRTIDPVLAASKPSFLDELSLTKFTLGSVAPRIASIKTNTASAVDDVLQMDWDLKFVPVDEDNISKRQHDVGNVRHSKIEVVAKVGKGAVAIPIPVVISEIEFTAKLKLELKFVSKFPHIQTIAYSFDGTPNIDFMLRPLKAMDVMDTPALKSSLNSVLAYGLSGFIFPNKNFLDLDAMINGSNQDHPVGVLKITLHEARNLKNIELAGVSDPYVVVTLAGVVVGQTRAIDNRNVPLKNFLRSNIVPLNSLNPFWGQTLFVPVLSSNLFAQSDGANADSLGFEIFDKNETGKDKSMGAINSLNLCRWVKLLENPNAPDGSKLSSGNDISDDERDALVAEWGVPFAESGSDIWHSIYPVDGSGLLNKEKKTRGDIRLELEYIPVKPKAAASSSDQQYTSYAEQGILTVVVHAAKELAIHKQSCLKCEIQLIAIDLSALGCLIGVSPQIRKSKNPSWEWSARVYVSQPANSRLRLELKDGSKIVGFLDLNVAKVLESLISKEAASDWYKLSNSQNTAAGKIRLTFEWNQVDAGYLSIEKSPKSVKRREPIGILKFKIVKAKGLANVEIIGRKSDPYAKIYVGHELIGATLVKENTLTPVWNETFFGILYGLSQNILIEFWDFNNLKKDKTLGRVELQVKDLLAFNQNISSKGALIEKMCADGLKVEVSGTACKVVAPIYFKAEETRENELETHSGKSNIDSPSETCINAMNEKNAREASQQRGFLYFDFELFNIVTEANSRINPLEKSELEFLKRVKNDVLKEISRLKKLKEVKILTSSEADEKIQEVSNRGSHSDITNQYDSGILRFHLYGVSQLSSAINSYAIVRLDGELVFSTQVQKKTTKPQWNTSVDLCIRSFKNQKVEIALVNSNDGETRQVSDGLVGIWSGELAPVIGIRNHLLPLEMSANFSSAALCISIGFIPVAATLSDTIYTIAIQHCSDTGILYIDLVKATNLEAVDHGGTSDPYCLIYLNNDLIRKTDVHRKTLDPEFKESVNCAIHSRLKSTLTFVVKDYNLIGKHTTLGSVDLDLADIKVGELMNITTSLDGSRSGVLYFTVFFDHKKHPTPMKSADGESLGAASMRSDNEDAAVLKMMKGVSSGAKDLFDRLGRQIVRDESIRASQDDISATEAAFKSGVDIPDDTGSSGLVQNSLLSGYVSLSIEEAVGLKAVDENGKADPYVKVIQTLHGKAVVLLKTKVVKKDLNPKWNETVSMKVPPALVTLAIKDKNLFGASKPMGEVEINLEEQFRNARVFEKWFDVSLGGTGRILVKGVLGMANMDDPQGHQASTSDASQQTPTETAKMKMRAFTNVVVASNTIHATAAPLTPTPEQAAEMQQALVEARVLRALSVLSGLTVDVNDARRIPKRNMQRIKVKVGAEESRMLGLRKIETDSESVEWFNRFLDQFWVQYEPSLSAGLKESIDNVLSSSKPGFLEDLSLSVFTLGSVAPRIDSIKTIMQPADDVLVMEWSLLFVPIDEDGVSRREREVGNVRGSKIEVIAKLGVGVVAVSLPITVTDIEFRGVLRLELKFVSKYPHVSKVDYSFIETPVVDFVLRPLRALDLMDLPALRASLDGGIGYALKDYVSPNKNSIDLDAIMNGTGADAPAGVLKVTFHEAKNLKNVELAGTSDPYVAVRLGGVVVGKSKVISSSLNPFWSQTIYIPVMMSSLNRKKTDPANIEELEFEIFDQNPATSDKSMGYVHSLNVARWVKLLDKPTVSQQNSEGQVTEKTENSGANTSGKSLSAGDLLTPSEIESLVTEWGTPQEDSGSDTWHPLFMKDTTGKDEKSVKGSLRLELSFLPVKPFDLNPIPATAATVEPRKTPSIDSLKSEPELRKQPEPSMGILTVTVHSGKEFAGSKFNTMRCEVSIFEGKRLESVVGSTLAVRKTNNPTWDCALRAYISDIQNREVFFSVKDGTKTMGDFKLRTSEILKILSSKDAGLDWYNLENCESGKIRITFNWHPLDPAYKALNLNGLSRAPKAVIKLKLVGAKALTNVEIMGRKSDPYAKLYIGHTLLGASLVKENTLDPVWNETFFGVAFSKSQKILVELWDFNNLKMDKSLGKVEIVMADLLGFFDDAVVKSKDFERLREDGLRVNKVSNGVNVIAPVYLDESALKGDLKNKSKKPKETEDAFDHVEEVSPSVTDPLKQSEKAKIDARAARLQRGFVCFELDFYDVADEQVIALDSEQRQFISHTREAVQSEINRLKTLAEVKVITEEEAQKRISALQAKGFVGDEKLDESKLVLLKLPTPDQITDKYDSGILRFGISSVKNVFRPINGYVDIRLDGFSVFSTRVQKISDTAVWNATCDVCVRSFKFQKASILIKDSKNDEAKDDDDTIVAVWEGSLIELVGKKKNWIELKGTESSLLLNVSLGFVPIEYSLSNTINDSGMLYVDIHSANNLEAVDSGGTSDPYCIVYLNGELLHKTDFRKKNLNPVFKESINCPIESRMKSTVEFIVMDHNAIGRHTVLGTAELDLMDITAGKPMTLGLPLVGGARSGQLNLIVFFDYNEKILPHKIKRSTSMTVDARLEGGEENAALKMIKGSGTGTVGLIKEIGKSFMGPTKQAQEHVTSAVSAAQKFGFVIEDMPTFTVTDELGNVQGLGHRSSSTEFGLTGRVILTIERAHNLKAVDDNGSADPYVKVYQMLHGKKTTLHKTKVKRNNLNPVWEETFTFKTPPTNISLVLKDFNVLGASKPLGEVDVDLEALFGDDSEFCETLPITLGGKGEITISGKIERVSAVGSPTGERSVSALSFASDTSSVAGMSGVKGGRANSALGRLQPFLTLRRAPSEKF
ncbi:hypothetical protein HDU84_009095 [Entophlyctis sp. JEL0112]|nr:hypothetical protein HDU84_009095 [Entophlyctis sp. JEL0112]